MSQYTYHHKQFAILAGWDRPLQYHFLIVERCGHDGDRTGEAIVYSNLADPTLERGGMTARQVVAKLRELKIPIPDALLNDLCNDEAENVGNFSHDYGVL